MSRYVRIAEGPQACPSRFNTLVYRAGSLGSSIFDTAVLSNSEFTRNRGVQYVASSLAAVRQTNAATVLPALAGSANGHHADRNGIRLTIQAPVRTVGPLYRCGAVSEPPQTPLP